MTTGWPGDNATVVNWVRSGLRRAARDSGEVELKGLDDIKVTAAFSGYDLEYLTLDATRTKLTRGWQTPPVPPEALAADTPEAEIIARQSGIMKSFRFTARPLRIAVEPAQHRPAGLRHPDRLADRCRAG